MGSSLTRVIPLTRAILPTRVIPLRGGPVLAAALGIAVVGCTSAAATPAGHPSNTQRACTARPHWASITLSDVTPLPAITVRADDHLVVTVPRWSSGTATDVRPARAGILTEQCTVSLPDHGRRTIFLATGTGSTYLGASVQPATRAMMPAWGATVTVPATPSPTSTAR